MEEFHVHLDTWAIREAIDGKYRDRVREIMEQGRQKPYSLVASQTAVGEGAAVILRGGPPAANMFVGMLGLLSDYRVDPGRCMPPLNMRVLDTARELVGVAPKLDMTDRVIYSHAVVDPNSVYLITRDSMLVRNSALERYEEEAGEAGLRNRVLKVINPVEAYPDF